MGVLQTFTIEFKSKLDLQDIAYKLRVSPSLICKKVINNWLEQNKELIDIDHNVSRSVPDVIDSDICGTKPPEKNIKIEPNPNIPMSPGTV